MEETTTSQTADASRRRERKAYSPDEAAELYGVGRSFIYEQIAAGQLFARKAGTRTLIKASILEVWFDNLPLSIKVKRRSA